MCNQYYHHLHRSTGPVDKFKFKNVETRQVFRAPPPSAPPALPAPRHAAVATPAPPRNISVIDNDDDFCPPEDLISKMVCFESTAVIFIFQENEHFEEKIRKQNSGGAVNNNQNNVNRPSANHLNRVQSLLTVLRHIESELTNGRDINVIQPPPSSDARDMSDVLSLVRRDSVKSFATSSFTPGQYNDSAAGAGQYNSAGAGQYNTAQGGGQYPAGQYNAMTVAGQYGNGPPVYNTAIGMTTPYQSNTRPSSALDPNVIPESLKHRDRCTHFDLCIS